MPRPMTEHERVVASLEWAQSLPCGWCGNEPRLKGDHLGEKCRAERDALYGPAKNELRALEDAP